VPIKQPKQSEKQKLIKLQLKIEPTLSSRTIAKQLGFSHVTVEKVKKSMLTSGQLTIPDTPPEWQSHPYFLENKDTIFKGLDARGLRALKAPKV